MAEAVRLCPVAEGDVDAIEQMFADPEALGEFLWGGWHDPRVWRRRWEDNRLLGGDKYVLMIMVGEERAGFVSWRPVEAETPWQYWEIGISLWPSARGQGHGTEAQRRLARRGALQRAAFGGPAGIVG